MDEYEIRIQTRKNMQQPQNHEMEIKLNNLFLCWPGYNFRLRFHGWKLCSMLVVQYGAQFILVMKWL